MPKPFKNVGATAPGNGRSVSGVGLLRQLRALRDNPAITPADRLVIEAHLRALLPSRPFAAFRGDGASRVKRRSRPGGAGQARIDAMQLSPAHSSSVAKMQRRERIIDRVGGAS